MENVKIKLPLIEFGLEPTTVKKYATMLLMVIGAGFIITLNSIVLNAIPNIYSGSIVMNAIFICIPNAIFAFVVASLASLTVLSGKVRIKKNKWTIPIFLVVTGVLSVTSSLLLNWAAGCNADACDIREGCYYLLKLSSAYAFTLLICSLTSFLITDLIFKYLYRKRNSFKWIADFVFPDIKKP